MSVMRPTGNFGLIGNSIIDDVSLVEGQTV
jgi:hypothetical protein